MSEINAERLESIKNAPNYPAVFDEFGIVKIYKDDFVWLIQRADKLQSLEETLEEEIGER